MWLPLSVHSSDADRIVVTGQRQSVQVSDSIPHTSGGNTGTFMQWVPGGGLNTNGQLSGILQYRGLFGPRVNVHIDQKPIAPSGPAWMDPPLHYAPKTLISSIKLHRGIASVSGGSGIGGYVEAELLTSKFTDQQAFDTYGKAEILGHSVDDGYNGALFFGVSNHQHRLHIFGSRDEGDDMEAGNGDIGATEYKRDAYGLGYGFQQGKHQFSVDYRRIDTGDSGTPSLPMDIVYYHGDISKVSYKTSWNGFDIDMALHHDDIEHQMANYILREAPDFSALPLPPFQGNERRGANNKSDASGFSVNIGKQFSSGYLQAGVDGHYSDHDTEVFDPDVADFYIQNIHGVEVDKLGIFLEWNAQLNARWSWETGIRYQNVETSSDQVGAFPADLADNNRVLNPVTRGAQELRDTFNAGDRRKSDDNIDAVLKFAYAADDNLTFSFGAARKTRSPDYVERYTWIPLEISSGLGDGNNYVGNPDLEPEFSHEIEMGVDWQYEKWYVSPRIYHRWVNNYIQGVDVSDDCGNASGYEQAVCDVSGLANGDVSPKRFANVDADIYGADMEFSYLFNADWRLDGIASYVRGRRRDISDNLFRIAPHKLQFALNRYYDTGHIRFESILVDEQDKLARSLLDSDNLGGQIDTNRTPGYILFNLHGEYHWQGQEGLTVVAGIENILNKHYQDHSAAFNRVIDSDVPVGERLPGAGRGIFLKMRYEW